MRNCITDHIENLLESVGVLGEHVFSAPPKPEMGDIAFGCFALAKHEGRNPNEVANDIELRIKNKESELVSDVKAFGPYVNFYLDGSAVAALVLSSPDKEENLGHGKRVLVEYGCPNPLKAFHLGHLRNIITGESVARILTLAGYEVKRVNYQGDVGMHVAKTLWAIYEHRLAEFRAVTQAPLAEKIAFLGESYAYGATEFEKSEDTQAAIGKYNERVYERDAAIEEIYKTTRQWSLDYFDTIYSKLGTAYDHLYFESEMYERGVELVHEFLKKEVFVSGDGGAIIFPGSKFGLHDRVFINSKGYPTYETKEVALAEKHFEDFHPDRVIHVVGKEQTEYFKVVIKAMETVVTESVGKEQHLVGGYLQLKGEQKMSSRKGNVVTGDDLIAAVEEQVAAVMDAAEIDKKLAAQNLAETKKRIAMAALKYTMLRSGVSDDIAFDMKTSVAIEGESGPYLLYIVARINSILKKANNKKQGTIIESVEQEEKKLLMTLADFPDVARAAAESLDPSHIAQYVFTLAQRFNSFYAACPVLTAEAGIQQFRLALIGHVRTVMVSGLDLLGIETVEEM